MSKKAKCIYKCGHYKFFEIEDGQPAERHIDIECEECRKKINQDIISFPGLNKMLIENPLKGSEKQLQYANKNRLKFIKFWAKSASDTQSKIVKSIIENELSAGWWMDNYSIMLENDFINNYESIYKTVKAVKTEKQQREKNTGTKKAPEGKLFSELNKLLMENPLKGSEKQLQYANKNRTKFVIYWAKSASDTQSEIVKSIIENELSAGWWMDNYSVILENDFINNYESLYKTVKKKKEENNADTILNETRKEEIIKHTLRPENILYPDCLIFIELRDSSTMIAAPSATSTENLKNLMLESHLSYIAELDIYMRDINELTGNYADRAAELAIRLLDNGYPVSILNNSILTQVRKRKYVPENDRWVKYYNADSVYLDWRGYERALCNRALNFIEGAHWNNDFKKVIIPASSYRQIIQYAESNGFSIEARAYKLMEKKRRQNM